jgi:hypothetical protein
LVIFCTEPRYYANVRKWGGGGGDDDDKASKKQNSEVVMSFTSKQSRNKNKNVCMKNTFLQISVP